MWDDVCWMGGGREGRGCVCRSWVYVCGMMCVGWGEGGREGREGRGCV